MDFKSNAKYKEPVESGTVFECKCGLLNISIHKIIYCSGWYLNCHKIGICDMELKSESLLAAINEGVNIVGEEIEKMKSEVETLKSEDITISR
jgi:hypothetical protein